MKYLPFINLDPQGTGIQYLEDLATAYWFSEVLFTAVEMDIFTLLHPAGKTVAEIAGDLGYDPAGVERFLQALCSLGLLGRDGLSFFNTGLARKHLIKGEEGYQGDSILWRKYLSTNWRGLQECLKAGGRVAYPTGEGQRERVQRIKKYMLAMDNVARVKVKDFVHIFRESNLEGKMLDVGAGSGAIAAGFLERFPFLRATLIDLHEVLECTRELMQVRGHGERVTYCPANILEPWPVDTGGFKLVILSNVIHAYSEEEVNFILDRAAKCLSDDGFLVIHDFFPEHYPPKAMLFDLNMFINTYNGKVFSSGWVRERLVTKGLHVTELVPLPSDTALLVAAKDGTGLSSLCLDRESCLTAKVQALGFRQVYPVSVDVVHVPEWADMRCRFGCSSYGRRHCPPNSPSPEKTRQVLQDYSRALLLEGEPPTREFQYRVLRAEKEAFQAGFYKAFAFWAGPCSLCNYCTTEGVCGNTRDARPSMEGAGIDVFETVRRAGLRLETVKDKNDYVKYFALVLLE